MLETYHQKLLFDCGWGCLGSLLDINVLTTEIDQIFISHSHADHLANLIPLLQSNINIGAFFPEKARKKDLFIHGYTGFEKDYELLRKTMFPERNDGYKINIVEHKNDQKVFLGIEVLWLHTFQVC